MSDLSIEQQLKKLKSKSFCPTKDNLPIFSSCSGAFCSRMCSVRKKWKELDEPLKNDLIQKIKTQYFIIR